MTASIWMMMLKNFSVFMEKLLSSQNQRILWCRPAFGFGLITSGQRLRWSEPLHLRWWLKTSCYSCEFSFLYSYTLIMYDRPAAGYGWIFKSADVISFWHLHHTTKNEISKTNKNNISIRKFDRFCFSYGTKKKTDERRGGMIMPVWGGSLYYLKEIHLSYREKRNSWILQHRFR